MSDPSVYMLKFPRTRKALIQRFLEFAETAPWGHYLEAPLSILPMAIFTMDFDGKGGVWINEASLASPMGRDLAEALKKAAPDRVHMQGLPGCFPAPFFPWPGGNAQ